MSKSKYYWYDIVKRIITEYHNLHEESPMEKRFLNAINLTLSQMNDTNREIVTAILIDKTKNIPDVAKERNTTIKPIALIVSAFVNEVGLKSGFEPEKGNKNYDVK